MHRLGKLLVLIFLCALVALTIASAPAGAGKGFKDCGDPTKRGAGVYNLKAKNVGCAKAEQIAKQYFRTGSETIGPFTCSDTRLGIEAFRARCLRSTPPGVIRFLFGS